jgi:hypothetical protein
MNDTNTETAARERENRNERNSRGENSVLSPESVSVELSRQLLLSRYSCVDYSQISKVFHSKVAPWKVEKFTESRKKALETQPKATKIKIQIKVYSAKVLDTNEIFCFERP